MAPITMQKGLDAFRTISEVADELDLPQHVLRFWETRFPSIKPLKRGGGRRYYRPDDVDLLKGIRHLLYSQGYTIKGVQRILKESGLRHVQAIGRGEEGAASPADGWRPSGEGDDWDVQIPDEPSASPDLARPRLLDRSDRLAPPADSRDAEVITLAEPPHASARTTEWPGPAESDDLSPLNRALDELFECARLLAALKTG